MLYKTLKPGYIWLREIAVDMRVAKELTGARTARAESMRRRNPKGKPGAERAQELVLFSSNDCHPTWMLGRLPSC